MHVKRPTSYIALFAIATLFMFLFQLEARLFSYVYLFHEGLLLIQSILLGGGLFLLLRHAVSTRVVEGIEARIPFFLVLAFALQQLVFFVFNSFVLDLLTLSLLFGLIFVEITHYISIKARLFYGIELLGSFAGVALYAIGVTYVLEEKLLIGAFVALVIYFLARVEPMRFKAPAVLAVFLLLGVYSHTLLSHDLPSLIQCSAGSTAYAYKSACLDDSAGITPAASFTHLKGRSDVFIRTDFYGNSFLEVKNNGYRVSAANLEAHKNEPWFELLEHRIPKLAYPDGARALSIGAGAGSYVQALDAYIDDPHITALEIDATVEDIYASERFSEYLPDRSSYEIRYEEGRRFVTLTEQTYDILTVSIEGINSTFAKYVDERTGLLYTTQALSAYIDHLNEGGYLILEQYYPLEEGGDAMAVKFLNTLHEASGESIETFREHLFMYTWAFNPTPSAQRFIAAIYKPEGFTPADREVLEQWIDDLRAFGGRGEGNPHRITTIHAPDGFTNEVNFRPFFDDSKRQQITAQANTDIITDDKPFRHLVTTLPFPPFSYALFALFLAGFLAVLGRLRYKRVLPGQRALGLSALFGILTFGLQYLLFYKTAAFINTNLIFFSIFLLVPLFFSSIGGFLSTRLTHTTRVICIILLALLSVGLVLLPAFSVHAAVLFGIIGFIFFVSGFLFPLVLERVPDARGRSLCYGANIAAGGFALMFMITLHATIGWLATFLITVLLTTVGAYLVSKKV